MHSHNRVAARLSIVGLSLIAALSFATNSLAIPGDLYVTDLTANSVFVVAFDGTVSPFASGLNQPQGIILDPSANVYVCDSGSGSILKFAPDGTQTMFATDLMNPVGIAFDGFNVLVAENGADMVTRIDPDGNKSLFQSVTAPTGLAISGSTVYIAHETSVLKVASDGTTTDFDLGSGTHAVAVISDIVNDMLEDTVFVSTDSDMVMEIAPDGTIMPFAPGTALVDPNGLAFRPARFSGDMDGVGNLYVAETTPGDILQFTKAGAVSTFAMSGNPNFLAFESGIISPTPAPRALNISTRVDVESGDNVAIGGIIISGADPKLVVFRAIGPSLTDADVPGALADPLIELHDSTGMMIATNDNWMDNSPDKLAVLADNDLEPTNDLESALVMSGLEPGLYTAIVKGSHGETGVALVEAYDLDDPATATGELANISTRGLVGTEANVLIGGVIIGPDVGEDAQVVIRGLGTSLANADPPVPGFLVDPVLEVHDANGMTIDTNDNWRDGDDATAIEDLGLAPTEDAEAALLESLAPGIRYTAVISGKNSTTGVALVEIYHIPTP